MPHGKILPYHALKTLTQLHAELGGKIDGNRRAGDKLRAQMVQVEAVIKMLEPDFSVKGISAKRRNVGNPWFKRGTLYRAVLDVLRDAPAPLTAAQICNAVLEGKEPQATHRQATVLQNAILSALRNRQGKSIERVGEGLPARWKLARE